MYPDAFKSGVKVSTLSGPRLNVIFWSGPNEPSEPNSYLLQWSVIVK